MKPFAHYSKSIFNDSSCPRKPVGEDALFVSLITKWERLEQILFQWKGIVTNKDVWKTLGRIVKCFWSRKSCLVLFKTLTQCAVSPHTSVRNTSICPNIYVNKFIVCVGDCHEDDTVGSFIIIKIGSTSGWRLYFHMFSTNRSNAIRKLPLHLKFMSNVSPFISVNRGLENGTKN